MKNRSVFCRLLTVALLLVLSLAFFAPEAEAATVTASGTCGDNLTWTLDSEGTLTVSGEGEISAEAFFWNDISLSIQDVVIEPGVTGIGENAFASCYSLTTVTIPHSVTYIGYGAFGDCGSLKAIYVDSSNTFFASDNGVLFSKDMTTLITCPGGYNGGYIIPDSVIYIEDYAFSSCSSLTNVTIGRNVTSIGAFSFGNCDNLVDITVPSGVTNIGFYAFRSCGSLQNISILNNEVSFGNNVFLECNKLTHILFAGTQEKWETVSGSSGLSDSTDLTVHCGAAGDELALITSGCSIKTFCCSACDYRLYLQTTPEHSYANGECTKCNVPESLEYSVDLNGKITVTGYTGSASQLSIPATIENLPVVCIGSRAFNGCESLLHLTLPEGLTETETGAFRNCYNLETVSIPSTLTILGNNTFYNCQSLKELTLPAGLSSINYYVFTGCSSLTGIYVEEGNTQFSSDENGVLFNKDKTQLLQCPGGYEGKYEIPSTVTEIGLAAFDGCKKMTEVVIPDSVTIVGNRAFISCDGLTQVVIPASVTAVEYYAFYLCPNLTSVTFEGDAPEIDGAAFRDVQITAYYPGDNSTWTEEVMQNYGGTITWVAQGHLHSYTGAVTTEATCIVDGVMTYTCSCGDSYTERIPATGHSYVNGTCTVCGAEDSNSVAPVEKFDLVGSNVALGNDLTMNFFVSKSYISETDYIEIVKEYGDGTSVTTTIPYADLADYFGVYWQVSLKGMAAKEMADKIEVTVYNADGVAISNTWTDSIRDYCVRQLDKANMADAYTLLADMLNYGAAAQTQFSYNTDDLANSTMTAAQAAYATQNFDLGNYSNNMVKGDNFIGSSLSLETNIILSMYFGKLVSTNGLTAIVTYTDHTGVAQRLEITEDKFVTLAGVYYGVVVDTLVASDVRQIVTLEVYDGDTLVASGADSMEGYAVRQGGDMNIALMKFTLSAYAYIHRNDA